MSELSAYVNWGDTSHKADNVNANDNDDDDEDNVVAAAAAVAGIY